MIKRLLFAFTFLISVVTIAQQLSLQGKVQDAAGKPLEGATVYLLNQKDSTVVTYTSTSAAGSFALKFSPLNEGALFKIEADRYFSFSKKYDKLDRTEDLGTIRLDRDSLFNIQEVKISAAPVKIKKDTVEFNASAIKVRPDSKIEELLKQIPGVEISNEGEITVNGKKADQILINGKPFFDKDGKIALKNLPADIIKNIQITTTKTKEEEVTGKAAKSNNATINFNIDEKKNKGFISRLTVGYGTDKRYEGSALASYFKGDTKLSLLAASNNINSQGFSNDEVFDSMGHGRNSWLFRGGSVTNEGGMTYYRMEGGQPGILRSTTVGANYSDKFTNKVDLQGLNAMYIDNRLETRSRVSRTTLLPDYTLKTDSENAGQNDRRQAAADLAVRVRPDTLTNIYYNANFNRQLQLSDSRSASRTYRDGTLLNTFNGLTIRDNENDAFSSNLYFSRKLQKKGRSVNLSTSNEITQDNSKNTNIFETNFLQGAVGSDNRNLWYRNRTNYATNRFGLGYNEPISDSVNVSVGFAYNTQQNNNLRDVQGFNKATSRYDLFNERLSFDMNHRIQTLAPSLGLNIEKKKVQLWSEVELNFIGLDVRSQFSGQDFRFDKKFIAPSLSAGLQYKITENLGLDFYNNLNYRVPTALQLTPYRDEINPLNIIQGNPDLDKSMRFGSYLYMNSYNMAKNRNYYLNMSFQLVNDDIVSATSYDAAGRQFTTYRNVDGNINVNGGGGYTKSWKWKDSKFTLNPGINVNFYRQNGFINDQMFTSRSLGLSPSLNLTYEIKDKITVKPSYRLDYNFSKYTNYTIDDAEMSFNRLKLELTNYFLKGNLVIGNDFEYNTNSNIAPGFKKDFYFWNTSLGYSFYKKQFTAKVKVYDVLNQNQSVKRVITGNYIEDRDDLILKRYVMFSLTMKLNKFAGKKAAG